MLHVEHYEADADDLLACVSLRDDVAFLTIGDVHFTMSFGVLAALRDRIDRCLGGADLAAFDLDDWPGRREQDRDAIEEGP